MLAAMARARDPPGRIRPRPCRRCEQRHTEEDQQAEHADGDLEVPIHPQWVLARRNVRGQEAAETHAAHERAEEDGQRHRRRANHEL